jgi:D-lactate dehydrogenase (cytochrome)
MALTAPIGGGHGAATSALAYGTVEPVLDTLRPLLGDRLITSAVVREQHGRDEGLHPGIPPDAVAMATSTEEAAAIVSACARHAVPVIPFGAGTSLEGGVGALHGGLCLDLSLMDLIVEVNPADLDVLVQAGVHRVALNERLRNEGLFFPIDPGADATLGGMASTRASGTNAVRYGTMRDNVLGLTAVLADGSVVRTGGRSRKSSAGYDLTRLLVGAEGTLGVITEVRLRLYGIPEAISAATCAFDTLEGAVQTTIETIQYGIPVARIELLDPVMVGACNRYSGLELAEQTTLFLEFHGSPASVAEQAESVGAIAAGHGGQAFAWATDQAERTRLWRARHDAYYAALALRPGCRGLPTDVCVPVSRLADCVLATRVDLDAAGVVAPIVGHVGDGNFHVLLLVDPDDPASHRLVDELNQRLVERAQAMGGTCTGEHGIGYGKLAFMEAEHGAPALAAMRAVKAALDPQGIMNPGKVVPAG